MQYVSNPYVSESQWNNIAGSLNKPQDPKQYRSQRTYNPYVSQQQWQGIDDAARSQWQGRKKTSPSKPSQPPPYKPRQQPVTQRTPTYTAGQAQPRQQSLGSPYPQPSSQATASFLPTGAISIPAYNLGRAFPVASPDDNSRAVEYGQSSSLEPAPSRAIWPGSGYEPKQPQLLSSYTPPQISAQPQFRPSFQASYTNFDGSVSAQPNYSLRDAFVQSINDSMIPYQTGRMSGSPQFDFQSLLGAARNMSNAGFQNPLAGLFG
jgi:hypothetical protein